MLPHLTQRLEFPAKPVAARELAAELAGVTGADAREDDLGNLQAGVFLRVGDETIDVWVRDEVEEADVAAVIAAHDAAAIEAAADAEKAARAARTANAETLRQRLRDGLADIDAQLAILAGAPTAAQLRAAVIFNLRALKALVRLELAELDATE